MASSNKIDAVKTQLGVPAVTQNDQQKRRPERKTFVFSSCGNLSVTFGSIAWVNQESGELDEPIPEFYARVKGYKNANGYDANIDLSDDPETLRAMAAAFNSIADFVEKSGRSLNRQYAVNQIDEAFNVFGRK